MNPKVKTDSKIASDTLTLPENWSRILIYSNSTKILSKKRKAFTLIELLVVIAIIAILATILMPSLNRARDMARDVVCQSNLRGIGIGCHLYAAEHNDAIVPAGIANNSQDLWIRSFILYHEDYVESPKMFKCPQVQTYQGEWTIESELVGWNPETSTYISVVPKPGTMVTYQGVDYAPYHTIPRYGEKLGDQELYEKILWDSEVFMVWHAEGYHMGKGPYGTRAVLCVDQTVRFFFDMTEETPSL